MEANFVMGTDNSRILGAKRFHDYSMIGCTVWLEKPCPKEMAMLVDASVRPFSGSP